MDTYDEFLADGPCNIRSPKGPLFENLLGGGFTADFAYETYNEIGS